MQQLLDSNTCMSYNNKHGEGAFSFLLVMNLFTNKKISVQTFDIIFQTVTHTKKRKQKIK